MKPLSKISLLVTGLLAFGASVAQAAEVNLYTTREPVLIQTLLTEFTQKTGVKVNTVFIKDGLLERVKAEGRRSPADVMLTVDFGNLVDLVESGLTQRVSSKTLNSAIPANLRAANGQGSARLPVAGCFITGLETLSICGRKDEKERNGAGTIQHNTLICA